SDVCSSDLRPWARPNPCRRRPTRPAPPAASRANCPRTRSPRRSAARRPMIDRPDDRFEARADKVAAHERAIQAKIDARAGDKDEDEGGAMQAGARRYPEPPFPEPHQRKPGDEAALAPAPMYDAPYWKGSGKLGGFAALITGADGGIGRAVAVLFGREGADVAICHLDEEADAEVTRAAVEKEGSKAIVLAGDAADAAAFTPSPARWAVTWPRAGCG